MELEAIRMVADWLTVVDHGVTALLTTLPRDDGDPLPTTPMIVDSTRTGWVARQEFHATQAASGPFLAVFPADDVTFESIGQQYGQTWESGTVKLCLGYCTTNPKTDEAERDALYVLRAARSSMHLLMRPENVAARTRNFARLDELTDLRNVRAFIPVGDAMLTKALVATFTAADVVAQPAP